MSKGSLNTQTRFSVYRHESKNIRQPFTVPGFFFHSTYNQGSVQSLTQALTNARQHKPRGHILHEANSEGFDWSVAFGDNSWRLSLTIKVGQMFVQLGCVLVWDVLVFLGMMVFYMSRNNALSYYDFSHGVSCF